MKIRPLNNYVLLKASSNNSKIKLEGGKILFLDTSFQKERHSDVVCEVVAVPDSLFFECTYDEQKDDNIPGDGTMPWDTDMELKVGDEVIIHYMAYVSAFGDDKKVFVFDGQEYFLCPYEMIYLAKRRWTKTEENAFWAMYGQIGVEKSVITNIAEQNNMVIDRDKIYSVIMLNGYVLVQPVEKELKSSLLDLPDSIFGKKTNKKKVIVRFSGKPNRKYVTGVYSDEVVSPGQVIIVDKNIDIPLEADDHRTFNGDQAYWRVQACLIHGLVS